MKKILSLLIAATIICSSISGFAATKSIDDIISLLSELNIMKGDTDGNMRLDDAVTRAEFTKIAVASSQYKNSVASNLTISPFKDVLYSHWAAPYIKLGVSNKICTGYPDGTFQPDGIVLYEEAVTMLLKVLGYTDNDFGISYPYGQVGLADNLEITKNVSKNIGDLLTRGDVASLVYNMMDTKIKESGKKQITVFDCEIIENATLIATNKEDPSVNTNKVLTSSGSYEIDDDFNYSYIGRKGDLVVKNSDEFVSFSPYEQVVTNHNVSTVIGSDLVLDDKVIKIDENLVTYYKSQKSTYQSVVNDADEGDTFVTYANPNGIIEYAMLISANSDVENVDINMLQKYVVYSKLDSAIVGYKDGLFNQIDIDDSTTAYKEKKKLTYSAIKSELSMGDILYVKNDNDNDIDYISYEKGNIDGPVTVNTSTWVNQFNLDADGISAMRDGSKVAIDDIQINDIVYYSKDLKMILAYSNKVTGVYEKALPNKDMPTSVVISNVTYSIESVDAFNALSSNGKFQYGDTVTLLLGKTKQIAGIISPNNTSSNVYGYMFETGKKEYTKNDNTKYSSNYIKLALPDGGVYEYIADKDYTTSKNSIVKLSFSNGVAIASVQRPQSAISGVFDWSAKKFSKASISSDLKILDITTINSGNTGNYIKVFPQRIDGLSFNSSNILFAEVNDNQIKTLILNNVTGDAYKYGIVINASSASKDLRSEGNYTYDINGKTSSLKTSNTIYNVYSGQPAKFSFTGSGNIDGVQPIDKIDGAITVVATTYIEIENKKYPLSDTATVYKKSADYNYTLIPLQDIIDKNSYNLTAYCDKAITGGGRVRVIVVN